MLWRLRLLLRKLGRLDKVFLVVLALAVIGNYVLALSLLEFVLVLATVALGAIVAVRWIALLLRKAIWRLRYRLIVAYLFIAVVPIALIFILITCGVYVLTGQIAAYLVMSDLETRTGAMLGPARSLAAESQYRIERARWVAPYFRQQFPGFEMLIGDDRATWRFPQDAGVEPPPPGWGDTSGLVIRGDRLWVWAHAVTDSAEVTMLAPMDEERLSSLIPNLGELSFVRRSPGAKGLTVTTGQPRSKEDHVPAPVNRFDIDIAYPEPVSVALWDRPGETERDFLFLRTRLSAVLQTVFRQRVDLSEGVTAASMAQLIFTGVGILLLLVELISVVIGIRLTRTITGAVHNLYEGTQRVRLGDFSHRIEVSGNDQLAELGDSFNRMTENLERLVDVAKEKERLQSEIEIAREVQNQLFPKTVPEAKTLSLAAECTPARLVSGDYYDYMNLDETGIALAIGDVSGKGISAALLMATVQSSMRTQLRTRELAMAAGNGGRSQAISTAQLVSRLNQQLFAYTPAEKFATFFFAIYDDRTGRMIYTNAGHLPPILVRNGVVSRLEVTGTVVGAFSFSDYGEAALVLEPGDLLACFTDGITEPENEFGEMFGEDRLAGVLVRNHDRASSEILAAVMDAVRTWTGSPELQDDMTMLLARRV